MEVKRLSKLKKKGVQIAQLPGVVVLLVVIAIILSIGSQITQEIRDDQVGGSCNLTNATACGFAFNNSDAGLKGLAKVADWQKTIGTVIGAAVVIGLVVGSFMFLSKR
jgi:hypothetical protein